MCAITPVSITFCGTPEFACPSLRALANDPSFTVTHVITQPDKPVGRKQILTRPPVKILAEELGIPVVQPEDINALFTIHNAQFRPDLLVVVAYGQILSKELLAWPKTAPINLHASLLPHLRGASPIQHAILENAKETGVTVQKMARKLDTGPILSQRGIPIDARETFVSLHDKLAAEGAKLLLQTLKAPLMEKPQDDALATFCGKLTKSMGDVDPATMTAEEIDRRIRALTPWPGVRTVLNGKEIILIESSLVPRAESCELSCAHESILYISTLKPAGGKTITGREWRNQHHKK